MGYLPRTFQGPIYFLTRSMLSGVVLSPQPEPCDGFVVDEVGVAPLSPTRSYHLAFEYVISMAIVTEVYPAITSFQGVSPTQGASFGPLKILCESR